MFLLRPIDPFLSALMGYFVWCFLCFFFLSFASAAHPMTPAAVTSAPPMIHGTAEFVVAAVVVWIGATTGAGVTGVGVGVTG